MGKLKNLIILDGKWAKIFGQQEEDKAPKIAIVEPEEDPKTEKERKREISRIQWARAQEKMAIRKKNRLSGWT